MDKPFEITITCHNQYGIELWNAPEHQMNFLRSAILDNWTSSEFYIAKQKANPFLQSSHDNFIMVEFWTNNFEEVEKYVDFLNEKYEQFCKDQNI